MSAPTSFGALLIIASVLYLLVWLMLEVHVYFYDQRKAADAAYDKGKRLKR